MQLAGEGRAGAQKGMIRTAVGIYQHEGFRRLYLGLAPAVLRQAVVGGVGVGAYPSIRDFLLHLQSRPAGQPMWAAVSSFSPDDSLEAAASSGSRAPLSFGTKVLAGATSGVIGQLLAAPMCVVKVRLQADARLAVPRYRGTLHALQTIPQQEGFRAFFRGIVPSLQRVAFMYGATISTYDHAKHEIVRALYGGDSRALDSAATHVMASSVSGLVATLVSTPFDTLKTRIINQPLQTSKPILGVLPAPGLRFATAAAAATAAGSSGASSLAAGAAASVSLPTPLYSSTLDCVLKTVRSEGVLSLYKGGLVCYARLAPWQLSFFVIYEQLSIALTGHSLR